MSISYYIKYIILGFPIDVGVIMLLVLLLGSVIILCLKGIKNRWCTFCRFMLFLYVALVFIITFFSRSGKDLFDYNFKPFWSYFEAIGGGRNELAAEMIMNVVLFVPFGFLCGLSYKNLKWRQILFVSFSISFTIEILQLVFKRGLAEFDDVFHNVIGYMVGYGCFLIIKKIYEIVSKMQVTVL